MSTILARRPSPALVVSLVALVAAASGTAVALPGKNRIDKNDIKKNAVGAKQIKKKAVGASELKRNAVNGAKIRNNAITGDDVDESSLGKVPNASEADAATLAGGTVGFNPIPLKKSAPTVGATSEAARAAAPEVPLLSKGPITIYGKCVAYPSPTPTSVEVFTFVKTSVPGVIYDSRGDELTGGPAAGDYLNPDTDEDDREINTSDSVSNSITFDNEDENDFSILAPDGTNLRGLLAHGGKEGAVFNDNAFGPGDGCVWFGFATG